MASIGNGYEVCCSHTQFFFTCLCCVLTTFGISAPPLKTHLVPGAQHPADREEMAVWRMHVLQSGGHRTVVCSSHVCGGKSPTFSYLSGGALPLYPPGARVALLRFVCVRSPEAKGPAESLRRQLLVNSTPHVCIATWLISSPAGKFRW